MQKNSVCYGILTTHPAIAVLSLHRITVLSYTMTTHNSFLGLIGNWQWYSDTFMVRLFLHLILSSCTDDTRWHDTVLHRGSLVTTIKALRAETGMSRARIRSCLERLQDGGDITFVRKGRHTIINVLTYDAYAEQPRNPTADNGDEAKPVCQDKAPEPVVCDLPAEVMNYVELFLNEFLGQHLRHLVPYEMVCRSGVSMRQLRQMALTLVCRRHIHSIRCNDRRSVFRQLGLELCAWLRGDKTYPPV